MLNGDYYDLYQWAAVLCQQNGTSIQRRKHYRSSEYFELLERSVSNLKLEAEAGFVPYYKWYEYRFRDGMGKPTKNVLQDHDGHNGFTKLYYQSLSLLLTTQLPAVSWIIAELSPLTHHAKTWIYTIHWLYNASFVR